MLCGNLAQGNKYTVLGFSGGSVVKTLPANAGDVVQSLSRNIPHAAEQLSPCTTTMEFVLQSLRATTTEAWAPCAQQQEKSPQ